MTSVIETPFFFHRGEVRLFGFLHSPAEQRRRTSFVFSHPFAEEKLWSHRVFVSFARALAERGFPVLRFDYAGAGDSSGATPDTTLETHLHDLDAAVRALREREPVAKRVGLMGLRLGASFAALYSERQAREQMSARGVEGPLILWDPILDGLQYFQDILRSNLSTQLAVYGKVRDNREVLQERILAGGTVNVDGYEIGKGLFESCAVPELLSRGRRAYAGSVLVMQVATGEQDTDRPELRALATSYASGAFLRCTEQPFWRELKAFYSRAENLESRTLDWLEQQDV